MIHDKGIDSCYGPDSQTRSLRRSVPFTGAPGAQRRPRYPAMNRTMTTRPTIQMILFMVQLEARAG